MTTPSPNPVGPELTGGPTQTVTSHLTPRSSPYHWSSTRPSVSGWYWCRRPSAATHGWDTRCVKAYQKNSAEVMRICYQPDMILAASDAFFDTCQFSFEPVPEPL
jgi:hypothetical protein